MTPAERTLRARLAAYVLHSRYDSKELTAAARRAFNDRFRKQVDPDGVLPPFERERRAEAAKKAYFTRLALKSAQARRRTKPPAAGSRAGASHVAAAGDRDLHDS